VIEALPGVVPILNGLPYVYVRGATLVSWNDPCDERRPVAMNLADGTTVTLGPDATDVRYFEPYFFWSDAPADGSPGLWILADDGALQPIGPGTDLASILVDAPSVVTADTPPPDMPPTDSPPRFFITLDDGVGGKLFGEWKPDAPFTDIARQVRHVIFYKRGRFGSRRARRALFVQSDVAGDVAVLRAIDELTLTPLLTVHGIREGSVYLPSDAAAILYLGGWDAGSARGELDALAFDGTAYALEPSASSYASLAWPTRALLYTIPSGDRAGVWMWVGGARQCSAGRCVPRPLVRGGARYISAPNTWQRSKSSLTDAPSIPNRIEIVSASSHGHHRP